MNITNKWVTDQINNGGVLSTAIYATNSFKLFFGGMYYVSACLKEDVPNHAVNIVGYNKDVYKFQNSWGKMLGMTSGFFYIKRHPALIADERRKCFCGGKSNECEASNVELM